MTHRRIVTLVTLIVALIVATQVTVVSAHDVCGDPPGDWCVSVATSASPTAEIRPIIDMDKVEQQKFLEEHGLTATSASPTVATDEQQRYLEESTIAAGTVPYYQTIDGATYYDRLTAQQETACIMIPYPCMVSFG